jgi:aspartate 4-decarboxylase
MFVRVSMSTLIEDYVERYNAATGSKLDKTKVMK